MDQCNDGPAFPKTCSQWPHHDNEGMSMREWYAGMALQGLCVTPAGEFWLNEEKVAKRAVEYADALLEELRK